jgi:hypothetical protein
MPKNTNPKGSGTLLKRKTKEKIEREADYRVTLALGPQDEAAKNRVTCREKNKAHFVIFIWKAQ